MDNTDLVRRRTRLLLPLVLVSLAGVTGCAEDLDDLKAAANKVKDKADAGDAPAADLSKDEALDLARYGIGTVAILSGADATALFGPQEAQNTDLANITDAPNVVGADDVGILAITERVTDCPGGGTITYIRDDQGPPWFSEGDTYTTTYDNCITGPVTTNGSRIFRVDVLQGQQWVTTPWSLKTTMSRQNFSVASPWGTRVVDGVSAIEMSSDDNVVYTQVTTGDWTNTRTNGGNATMSTSNYTISHTWDENLNTFALEFDVASTSAIFDDVVTRTLIPLSGTIGQPPDAGEAEIIRTSPAGTVSIVTVTALPGGLARMAIDSDGDGIIDSVQDTTWAQIGIDAYLYQFF